MNYETILYAGADPGGGGLRVLKHPPKFPKVNLGERDRALTCILNGRVVTIDRPAYVHPYFACAALRTKLM